MNVLNNKKEDERERGRRKRRKTKNHKCEKGGKWAFSTSAQNQTTAYRCSQMTGTLEKLRIEHETDLIKNICPASSRTTIDIRACSQNIYLGI